MKDGSLEAVSMIGTALITAGLFVPVLYLTEKAKVERPDLSNMESIEASIAYKTAKPQKQPQKKIVAPEPVEKPEGVSHDETKKPTPKKDEEPKKKPDKKEDLDITKFKHPNDDSDTGKPTVQPGEFNPDPNAAGWAPKTSGAPFWQQFAKDIHDNFSVPTISDVKGTPVGCFHITPDGKIPEILFKDKSGSPDLDRAAQDALEAVQKLRNQHPTPVPTELLGQTTHFLCFRFDPNKV